MSGEVAIRSKRFPGFAAQNGDATGMASSNCHLCAVINLSFKLHTAVIVAAYHCHLSIVSPPEIEGVGLGVADNLMESFLPMKGEGVLIWSRPERKRHGTCGVLHPEEHVGLSIGTLPGTGPLAGSREGSLVQVPFVHERRSILMGVLSSVLPSGHRNRFAVFQVGPRRWLNRAIGMVGALIASAPFALKRLSAPSPLSDEKFGLPTLSF